MVELKETFPLASYFVAFLIPRISFHHSLPLLSHLIMVNGLKHEREKHTLIIVYLTANDNFPRRRGIINLSTNLASFESVLKVKCFMFRNFWADCCCSSRNLIVCSDFSSSLEADETTSVNLQNKTTEVVCFLVPLKPRLNHANGIWKRRFQSENSSNVFRKHHAGGIKKRNNHRSFWIFVWGKLGQRDHVIIVTSSFWKSSVFKMFSSTRKRKSGHGVYGLVWTVGLTVK